MNPKERKAACDGLVTQLGMLVASLATDPRCDAMLVASAREILTALRELNRALGRLATETPAPKR